MKLSPSSSTDDKLLSCLSLPILQEGHGALVSFPQKNRNSGRGEGGQYLLQSHKPDKYFINMHNLPKCLLFITTKTLVWEGLAQRRPEALENLLIQVLTAYFCYQGYAGVAEEMVYLHKCYL